MADASRLFALEKCTHKRFRDKQPRFVYLYHFFLTYVRKINSKMAGWKMACDQVGEKVRRFICLVRKWKIEQNFKISLCSFFVCLEIRENHHAYVRMYICTRIRKQAVSELSRLALRGLYSIIRTLHRSSSAYGHDAKRMWLLC